MLILDEGLDELDQGHFAAFAFIVEAHHDGQVLDADHDGQRPKDHRQDTEDLALCRFQSVVRREALLDGVERAGADVAVHNTDRPDGQGEHSFLVRRLRS